MLFSAHTICVEPSREIACTQEQALVFSTLKVQPSELQWKVQPSEDPSWAEDQLQCIGDPPPRTPVSIFKS